LAAARISCLLVQFVLIQFLGVGSFGNTRPLRRNGSTFGIQGKMHAVKGAKHRNRVIAPQSAVTPNDVLRHTYYPTRHMRISTVDKLPATPVFVAGRRTRLTGIVILAATELFLVTVILLAG